MLNVNQYSAVVPDFVLKNYKNLEISDTELITLLHLQCVPERGKKGLEQVATNMGYSSLAPLTATLNRLVEKNAITMDGYNVDATNLWVKCGGAVVDTPIEKPKPVSKSDQIARETLNSIWQQTDKTNYNQLLAVVKKLLKKITPVELQNFVNYTEGRNKAVQAYYKRDFFEPVSAYMLSKYVDQWVVKGKPSMYTNQNDQPKEAKQYI